MEQEQNNLKDEVAEIKEDVADIKKDVAEVENKVEEIKEEVAEKTNEPLRDENKKENKKKNIITYIIILVLIVAAATVIYLDYPKISSYIKDKVNPYGFDFNYNKVRQYDWDTILTKKKVASIWNTSRKNINSERYPDSSFILEDQKQFVNEASCATMLEESILDQENQDKENLLNVSVLLCQNTDETKTTYSSRKDGIKNAGQSDSTITVKGVYDTKGLGNEGYTYSIEQASATAETASDKYAGTVVREGPFIIIIGESEKQSSDQQQSSFYLSSDNMELKIAQYLDKELKKLLAWD